MLVASDMAERKALYLTSWFVIMHRFIINLFLSDNWQTPAKKTEYAKIYY